MPPVGIAARSVRRSEGRIGPPIRRTRDAIFEGFPRAWVGRIAGLIFRIANLWPQLAAGPLGYRRKDVLEVRLKGLVCARQLTLRTARRAIATDWVAAYWRYVLS